MMAAVVVYRYKQGTYGSLANPPLTKKLVSIVVYKQGTYVAGNLRFPCKPSLN
jgi:hypothetical protein